MQAMSQMRSLKQARNQKGFTIIELVVVILLLGILAATALPRFIDVTDQAHDAVFEATVGGFTTGISMYRAQYFADGQPASVSLDGQAVAFNTDGYPRVLGKGDVGFAAATSVGQCRDVFNAVLQSGRPTISAVTTAATDYAVVDFEGLDSDEYDFTTDVTSDFRVLFFEGLEEREEDDLVDDPLTTWIDESAAGDAIAPVCHFMYTAQYQDHTAGTDGGRTGVPVFTYNPRSGEIRSFNSADADDQG